MLPERLSGELCSLQEGLDRLTLTAWITLSPDLEVVETRLSESVIRSRKRLSYDQVKAACMDLDRPRGRPWATKSAPCWRRPCGCPAA